MLAWCSACAATEQASLNESKQPIAACRAAMIRVALYLAIAGDQQDKPVVETGWGATKRRVNRGLDRLRWSAAPSRGAHHYIWSSHNNSNKGDHTIRAAIREQLTTAFPGRDVRFTELGWGGLTPDPSPSIR